MANSFSFCKIQCLLLCGIVFFNFFSFNAEAFQQKGVDTLSVYQNHALILKGDEFSKKEDVKNAVAFYKKAHDDFSKNKQYAGAILAFNKLGAAFANAKQQASDSVVFYLEKAIEIAKKQKLRKHPFTTDTYLSLGKIHHDLQNTDKAHYYYQLALEQLKKDYPKGQMAVVEVLKLLGLVYHDQLSQEYEGEKYSLEALSIYEKLAEPKDKVILVKLCHDLGRVNETKGDTEKARYYGFKALDLLEKNSIKDDYLTAGLYRLIGGTYSSDRNFSEALKFHHKALPYAMKDPVQYANIYVNIGGVHSGQDRLDEAVNAYNHALKVLKDYPDKENQSYLKNLAGVYRGLSIVFSKKEIFSAAALYSSEYLRVFRQLFSERHLQVMYAYRWHSRNVFYRQGLIDSALYYMQKSVIAGTKHYTNEDILSIPPLEEIGKNYNALWILWEKGVMLKEKFNASNNLVYLKAALKTHQLVDSLITNERIDLGNEEANLISASDYQEIYNEAIDVAYELWTITREERYLGIAFNFIENNKSQIFQDGLNDVKSNRKLQVSDTLKQKQQELKYKEKMYQAQLQVENSSIIPDQENIATLNEKLFVVTREREKVENVLRRQDKRSPEFIAKGAFKGFNEIKALVQKHEVPMLQYFWADTCLYIIHVDKDVVAFDKISGEEFETLNLYLTIYFNALRQGIKPADINLQYKGFVESASFLFESLLKPYVYVKKKKVVKELIIIPDGMLFYLPFEALLVSSPESKEVNYQNLDYLIKHTNVAYYNSANLYYTFMAKPALVKNPSFLAFAYSGKENGSVTYDYVQRNNIRLMTLPGTTREVQSINKIMQGVHLMDTLSSEYNFKKLVSGFDIIHLAVHGMADTTSRYTSSLFFRNESDTVEDGVLYSYELYNLDIKARLAVLSACETGVGKIQKGEGVFSIARAFAYAGCPSIVMSLWMVNDEATSRLMVNFYKHLKDNNRIDYSLRLAKLEYLKEANRYTAHPSFWAAFIATGDMSPVFPDEDDHIFDFKENSNVLIVLVIIVVLLFVSVAYIRLRKKKTL